VKKVILKGTVTLPGDKSLSHRAIIFAGLAEGKSRIRNLSRGADVATTMKLFQDLGASAESTGGETIVQGCGLSNLRAVSKSLDCGNSGTSLRLMMGVLAGSNTAVTLAGDESLNRRPVMRVIEPLRLMGADLATSGEGDHPPVTINGRKLHGITYASQVASAQVKSAVLLAALHAEGLTHYTEPTQSRDHTERFLAAQGVDIKVTEAGINLSPGATLQPFDQVVAGDISTAAFYIVAALLSSGSEILIKNVGLNPTRTGALTILNRMGAEILTENQRDVYGEPVGDLIVRSSTLSGVDTAGLNLATYIDEVPILAVAAMFAEGETKFHNLGELRVKESDRLQGTADIVSALGGNAEIDGDTLIISGGCRGALRDLDARQDHRLAMAIEVANLVLAGELAGAYQEMIAISAPEFYETIRTLKL
jgi:3-phosphoshikimate 1-carboxyvinyltransferase